MMGTLTAFAFVALSVAVLLACFRLVRGPSLADRVIALDMISYLVIGMIAVHVLAAGQPQFLDAAIVLALIAFLGTIAFARYLGRAHHRRRSDK